MKIPGQWFRPFVFGMMGLAMVGTWAARGDAQDRREIRVERSSGDRYSLELREADIRDVLRAISQERGINVVIGEGVEGKVTLSFQSVTLADAMDAILKTGDWAKVEEGGITRIVKSSIQEGTGDLVTRMLPVQYAKAKDLQEGVKDLLSKKGSATVDERTNTLIVRDVAASVEWITTLVNQLDSRTPQVMIEARIVEASTNFSREIGVQWGGSYATQSGNRTTTLHGGTRQLSTNTAVLPLTGGLGFSGGPFAVNLPAAVGPGSGGALGISFGNLTDTVRLDLQLSALEDSGQGRILSTPRVLTLDNKEAKISAGTEILIPTTTIVTAGTDTGGGAAEAPTGVQTIDAKLELAVTPHVTPNGEIVMHVRADKKDPDYTRQVQDIPPLTSRSAETHLLVKNGETVVIGGIVVNSSSRSENGIPWLSKIPLLGWLFKKQSTVESQNELLVFITPTIYDGQSL
ncbi:MAG: type IV pilus secretin PilQ [Nitrospirota bacterium]